MVYKLKEAPRRPVSESECRHYWMIEDARGSTSRGVCKFCGAEKEFSNSWPDFTAMKRNNNVLELPNLPDIEPDGEWDDSKLKESSANL